MSLSTHSARIGLGVVIAIGILTTAAPLANKSQAVTAELRAAARHGTVEQMASALASQGKGVGVVLLPDDVQAPASRPQVADGPPEFDLSEAIREFEERISTYNVARTASGGFLIRPRTGSVCIGLLRRPGSLTASGPAFELLHKIFHRWSKDPSPELPPGIVGTGTIDSADVYRRVIALDLVRASFEDALNAIVDQVPSLGWAIREVVVPKRGFEPTQGRLAACNLALFDGASWLNTSLTAYVPIK